MRAPGVKRVGRHYRTMTFEPNDQWARVQIDETLVGRRPGGSAADKAQELRHEAPVRSVAARLLRVHTPERGWRKGASGERWTGWWLSRLPNGWFVFNDIPVGERGANIDHLVVGPGGVLTVNAKNLNGKVWVGLKTFMVNGHRTDYLPKAANEAKRASRMLSTALGHEVAVRGSLAVIADDIIIKQQPEDVLVASPRGLKDWLLERSRVMTAQEVIEIAGVAAKPSTWHETQGHEGMACLCGGQLVRRMRRDDGQAFLGCSQFPACRRTWPFAKP